jgi:DNA-binding transcriptional regulator YiaG
MNNLDPLLSAQQLADYLNVPLATLYAWRHRHEGPPASEPADTSDIG